ncbi:MAG: GNAT family N-acetyltransferase [Candidatus Limnocylindrales bacterium]
MEAKIVVRPVHEADRPGWERLWDGYNAFYQRIIPPAATGVTWSRFFDAGEPLHALVAEEDGALVGLAHYLFHRSTSTVELTCYLQDLFTAPSGRRRGVGRALIETVYRRAGDAGSTRVYWQTHETNETAMRLYDQVADRSGFLVYQRRI